jgi:hypothetical protein
VGAVLPAGRWAAWSPGLRRRCLAGRGGPLPPLPEHPRFRGAGKPARPPRGGAARRKRARTGPVARLQLGLAGRAAQQLGQHVTQVRPQRARRAVDAERAGDGAGGAHDVALEHLVAGGGVAARGVGVRAVRGRQPATRREKAVPAPAAGADRRRARAAPSPGRTPLAPARGRGRPASTLRRPRKGLPWWGDGRSGMPRRCRRHAQRAGPPPSSTRKHHPACQRRPPVPHRWRPAWWRQRTSPRWRARRRAAAARRRACRTSPGARPWPLPRQRWPCPSIP